MSRHLRVLRSSGLVEEARDERDARARVYRLRPERFRALRDWLARVEGFWGEQLGAFERYVARGEAPARKSPRDRR